MLIISLSGPSGVGKNTILSEILANTEFVQTPHATTRPRRSDSDEYVFLSKQEFEDKIRSGEIIEYTIFNDNYYGTFAPCEPKNMMLLDYIGIEKVKKHSSNNNIAYKSFFLELNDDTRRQRMSNRGDSDEIIQKRLNDDKANYENSKRLCDFTLDASKTPQEILQEFLEILDTQGLI